MILQSGEPLSIRHWDAQSQQQSSLDTLRITLFGFPQVRLGGKPITFARRAAMALLAYLAISPRSHSRETLATLLSGEVAEERARTSLRNALNDLSTQIGSHLLITRQTVSLNWDKPLATDAAYLEEALRVARTTGETRQLQLAVEQCQHELLEGFALRDAPVFDEWLLIERQRYNSLLVEALDLLSHSCVERGDYTAGLTWARRLSTLEPWHEETQQHLASTLARAGQRGTTEKQNTVPATNGFVGRQRELKRLTTWLNDPTCRLITITGVGGCGKTRLALHMARYSSGETSGVRQFPDGVFYVALEHVAAEPHNESEAARRILRAIAQAIGIVLNEQANLADQVADRLEQRVALLVVDNVEHVRCGVAVLERLLRLAPGIAFLVTSRVQLALEGARTLTLGPMELPAGADDLECADAGVLFLQQARQARTMFEPNQAQRAAIVRICRYVEGLPLGIVLAAYLVRTLDCGAIAARLSDGISWLAVDAPELPERHSSLAANFSYSWALLAAGEQRVLRLLSVFEGPFAVDAAVAVTATPAAQLQALRDAGMVAAAADGRLYISGLLRPHIAQLCQQAGEEQEVRLRHASYYTKIMTQSLPVIVRQGKKTQTIERDLPNIQAAWAWMMAQVE